MVLLSNETGFLLQTFLYFVHYDINNTLIDTVQMKNITAKELDGPDIEVKGKNINNLNYFMSERFLCL